MLTNTFGVKRTNMVVIVHECCDMLYMTRNCDFEYAESIDPLHSHAAEMLAESLGYLGSVPIPVAVIYSEHGTICYYKIRHMVRPKGLTSIDLNKLSKRNKAVAAIIQAGLTGELQ